MSRIPHYFTEFIFTRDLSPLHLAHLVHNSREVAFSQGQLLARQGEPANAFFMVLDGGVRLEMNGHERGVLPILSLGPGEVVGVSWLFPPHLWDCDLRITAVTRLVELDGVALRDRCHQDSQFAIEMYKRVGTMANRRMKILRYQILDLFPLMPSK